MSTVINGSSPSITFSDGTTQSTAVNISSPFTANGVVYASSTSALATGSALTFDGSNLGIGTSSPTDTGSYGRALDLVGSSSGASLYVRGSSNSSTLYASFAYDAGSNRTNIAALGTGNFLRFVTVNAEVGRFDSSGNLLVGTTSASTYVNTTKFQSAQGYTTDSNTTTPSTQRTAGVFYVDAGASSNNQGSYCSIVGIASSGASSNPGAIFRGYGGAGGGTLNVQINYNGNITNTNNSYGAISDVILKENIVDATPKLADLIKVQVRNYNLKDDEKKIKQIGVVAQELETIFPSMIEQNTDGTKSVKYSVFVPMLIKAIQELNTLVTTQSAEIAALKQKVGI
jgi:hypothetical protein